MKKLFTLLLLLTGGVFLSTAYAVDITVGGVDVTTSNCSNIKPAGLKSGKISYDFDTKELILDNVVYSSTTSDYFIYNSGRDGLYIYVKGDCSVTCYGSCIRLDKNTTISALNNYGKLTLKSTATSGGYIGLWLEGAITCNVYWIDLVVNANVPIWGTKKEILNVNCATVEATSTSNSAAVRDLKDLYLTSVHFDKANHKFSNGMVVDASGSGVTSTTIDADLRVNRQIIDLNKSYSSFNNDALGKTSAGTVSWDHTTKTLTFNGVTQKCSAYHNIYNTRVNGLKVLFKGANTLNNTSDKEVVKSRSKLTLEGSSASSSVCYMNSQSSLGGVWGVWMIDSSLTVRNLNLGISAQKYGISSTTSTALYIDNSQVNVSVRDENGEAITKIKTCQLTNCDVSAPSGCCYRTSLKGFGSTAGLSNSVSIQRYTQTYPVSIYGHRLNDVNIGNMAFDGMTRGTMSYDVNAKKLTLDGVTMENPEGNVNSGISITGADIAVISINNITSAASCLVPSGTVNITGGGTLNLTSTQYAGVSTSGETNLTLDMGGGTFIAQGDTYGYWGGNDVLTLKKAMKNAGKYYFMGKNRAFQSMKELNLVNVGYLPNQPLYFKNNSVYDNTGTTVKEVTYWSVEEYLPVTFAGKQLCRTATSSETNIYVGSEYITAGGNNAVIYNPSSKTLTLNNATIEYPGNDYVVNNTGLDGFTVSLKGKSKVVANETTCFRSNNNMIFKGDASASLDLVGYLPVYLVGSNDAQNKSITFDGAQVSMKGSSNYALCGKSGTYGESLVLKNGAAVKAEAARAISDFSSIQLYNGIKISKPLGGTISEFQDGYGIMTANGSIANSVILSNGNSIFDIKKGDANGNGEVTMSDANLVVNYYLATDKSSVEINIEAADANGDGQVTMTDANTIVNMYLTGSVE